MPVNLEVILRKAKEENFILPCFNVFAFEYAKAVVSTAERLQRPVILGVSKAFLEFMPLQSIAGMLLPLAENAGVPVCVHLDHNSDFSTIHQALDSGFTSVMYDGSQLGLHQNIKNTLSVVRLAEKYQASVEAEVGSVPYLEGNDEIKNELSIPEEVCKLYKETGVNLIAVSVGNLHRSTTATAQIRFDLLAEISNLAEVPLCIHGGSGVVKEDLPKLNQTKVLKVNIGTSLRIVWFETLKNLIITEKEKFDSIYFLKQLVPPMEKKAEEYFRLLGNF